MKINMLKRIMVVAAGIASVSCIKNDVPAASDGYGTLVISGLNVTEDVTQTTHGTRAVTIDAFNVIIVEAGTSNEVFQAIYSEIDGPIPLPAGLYTITVESHDVVDADWENVYYAVSQTFEIKEDKPTELGELVCKVSNILVSVRFSDSMKEIMESDFRVVVKIGNCGPLTYDIDETRRGTFKAETETNTLVWEYSGNLDGEFHYDTDFIQNVKAGEHHTLGFDIQKTPDPESGDAAFVFTVTVDCTTYDVNLNVFVDEEEVIEPFEPEIQVSSELSLTEVNTVKASELPVSGLSLDINAKNGLTGLLMEITTDNDDVEAALSALGISGEIDLVNPGAAQAELENLGLPTGAEVTGATLLQLDLSGFVTILSENGNTEQFDIRIALSDAVGNDAEHTVRLEFVDDTVKDGISMEGIEGFILDERQTLLASAEQQPVIGVALKVPDGIALLTVDIVSDNYGFSKEGLEEVNMTDHLDLTYPGEMKDGIASLGLPYGDQVLDKTDLVFDVTDFIDLIFVIYKIPAEPEPFDVDFVITVEDNSGASLSRSIMLHIDG